MFVPFECGADQVLTQGARPDEGTRHDVPVAPSGDSALCSAISSSTSLPT